MSDKPNYAFILAAGKGTRLRPYTDTTPKPMVIVNGRPILDHTLGKLEKVDVTHVTINTMHLGHVIEQYYSTRTSPKITFSKEDELLDTGGGVKKALNTIKSDAFYVINGDALWEDNAEGQSVLEHLAQNWDADKMDMLLLLKPVNLNNASEASGDYSIEADGRPVRSLDGTGTHMFSGIRISSKHIFDGAPEGTFSYLELMDKAEKDGRLYAVELQGTWHHISTAEDLERVNALMSKAENSAKAV